MSLVTDVLNVLDRIPIWRRLQTVPEEVDGLKARVAALEEMLGGKYPAEVCRFCGARAVRLAEQRGREENWVCADCGQTDCRLR